MFEPTWTCVSSALLELAEADLAAGHDVRPLLLGFAGQDPLVGIELRRHPAGGREAPVIEALALAAPLGADRLAYLASARAWSLDDPIPPASDGIDLRQPVVVVHLVDGHDRRVTTRTAIRPYDRDDDGRLRWRPAMEAAGGEGWLCHALEITVTHGHELQDQDQLAIGRQALRLTRLGHGLLLPPAGGSARLADAVAVATASEAEGGSQPHWTLTSVDGPVGPPPR
jgi:hypothetical protein